MGMQVRALRDFAGRLGAIVHKGEFVKFEHDEDAYRLIHAGLAEPPLRLRSAGDHLIGSHCYEKGEMVDLPNDRVWLSGEDVRVEPLAAVVPAAPAEHTSNGAHHVIPPGKPIAVPPSVALEIVRAGGRYATQEEAAGLDLGGRDRFPKPAAPQEPQGPDVVRLFFVNAYQFADGRRVQGGTITSVLPAEADELLEKGFAESVVKVRAKYDGLCLNRACSQGDVVEVARSMAKDKDRFERLGAAGVADKAVDVLAAIGEGKASAKEKPARAARTLVDSDAK